MADPSASVSTTPAGDQFNVSPFGATRVVTAIGDGGSATLNPVNVLIEEGF